MLSFEGFKGTVDLPVIGFMKKRVKRKTGMKKVRLGEKNELSCRFSQIPLLGVFPDLVFACRLNPTQNTHVTHHHT